MKEHEVRNWFGNRGCPLDDDVKLKYEIITKNGENWIFLLDNCHDYESYDEVESFSLDSNCVECYDAWPSKNFNWSKENLLTLV